MMVKKKPKKPKKIGVITIKAKSIKRILNKSKTQVFFI